VRAAVSAALAAEMRRDEIRGEEKEGGVSVGGDHGTTGHIYHRPPPSKICNGK
jgi:hypothetical protein